ncbi:hypothetical protein FRB96_003878 [Tulasnella sp. 330]|nr:hypothetical protein FRB96_003878 [Tulasnella sp. 330]KAG8876796.1 hypothetical protein FRB97_003919 [Tulasnella sp. 331]
MPRQSRSRPAPRPAAPAPQQSRGAHTAAAPPQQYGQHPPQPPVPAQQQGPGMLGQMAATAGSVAIGSTLGHGLSSMLFGGGSREAAAPAPEAAAPPQQQYTQPMSCDFQAKEFTKCLETADVASCGWYLEQLKACQAAARPY